MLEAVGWVSRRGVYRPHQSQGLHTRDGKTGRFWDTGHKEGMDKARQETMLRRQSTMV